MRPQSPFLPGDLDDLDRLLLARADQVVSMREVFHGNAAAGVIGLRHDVDDNVGSLDTALKMADWEHERGYSSTYYLLHGSRYWKHEMPVVAPLLEELGHEVGLHVNAIAEAFRQQRSPSEILIEALIELRASGVRVAGCVAHGDRLCHQAHFVNDEIFRESPRPDWGEPNRTISHDGYKITLEPVSRRMYGLDYDASWLPRTAYLSDSGGRWQNGYSDAAFDEVADGFPFAGQLHMLVHPDWWAQAFAPDRVAA